MNIQIRVAEGDDAPVVLLWDSVWDPVQGQADWAAASPAEIGNVGGLQAQHALDTAVILCLFTWRRAETYDALPTKSSDLKGWWGDAIDLEDNEKPMGSRLWLLFRSVLNAKVAATAKDYCVEALQTLIDQGAVARIDVTTEAQVVAGILAIRVQLYSTSGARTYDQKFDILWRQEFR
jgi:phage gp46-like protein